MLRALTTAIVLALVTAGSPSTADARPSISTLQIKDTAVTASFVSVDDTGCIETRVHVTASNQMQRVSPPGSRTATAQTVLVITRIDVCAALPLFVGDGLAEVQTLQVAPNLRTATVSGIVPVTDQEGVVHQFAVNLTWTATGPATRTHNHEIARDEELGVIISGVRGTHVPAVATGSVLGLGENWTPEPSQTAEILSGSGVITIQRTR